jgi:hypothetical protein
MLDPTPGAWPSKDPKDRPLDLAERYLSYEKLVFSSAVIWK